MRLVADEDIRRAAEAMQKIDKEELRKLVDMVEAGKVQAVVKAAASDPRVARIFIFPGAKVEMCKNAGSDRAWLRKVRPWYGHHYHFHVRLSCPKGARGCVDQAPPPPGDGCADAQAWVDNILNPPPPDPNAKPPKPKPDIRLADLPAQCAAVLQSP